MPVLTASTATNLNNEFKMEEKFSSNLLKQVVNVEATSGLSAVSPQTPRAPQDTGQSAVAHCNQGLNGDGGGGCACDDDYSDEDCI